MNMNILIADDHPIYAEGLENLLRSYDFEVAGIAADGREAVEKTLELQPDVVLMDVHMPKLDGIEAARHIASRLPNTKIIMLTVVENDDILLRAIEAGADGYLLKNLDGEELYKSLMDIVAGKNPFTAGLQQILLQAYREQSLHIHNVDRALSQPALTRQQKEILLGIAEGFVYKEIGAQLNISERTVKYHIGKIKKALGLRSRDQLIAYYRSHIKGDE